MIIVANLLPVVYSSNTYAESLSVNSTSSSVSGTATIWGPQNTSEASELFPLYDISNPDDIKLINKITANVSFYANTANSKAGTGYGNCNMQLFDSEGNLVSESGVSSYSDASKTIEMSLMGKAISTQYGYVKFVCESGVIDDDTKPGTTSGSASVTAPSTIQLIYSVK